MSISGCFDAYFAPPPYEDLSIGEVLNWSQFQLHNTQGINMSDISDPSNCGDTDMMKFVVFALFVAGGKDLFNTTLSQLTH